MNGGRGPNPAQGEPKESAIFRTLNSIATLAFLGVACLFALGAISSNAAEPNLVPPELVINAPGPITGTHNANAGEQSATIPEGGVTAGILDGNLFFDVDDNPALGCTQIGFGGTFAGKIILFDSPAGCPAVWTAFFAEFAGALGVLIAETTGTGLPDVSGLISNSINIPYIGIEKSVADSLRANLGTANVTMQNSTTDTDGDGVPDIIDPDDDNDGIGDALDTDPLVANNDCTDNDGMNATLVGATISAQQTTCAAKESVEVSGTTNVGIGGDLRLISEKVSLTDMSVTDNGRMEVINADPCPGCPVCGNGILEAPEECDDGNISDGDGCSSVCLIEP